MVTSKYFEQEIARKRPYIERSWCERALRAPELRERHLDGRILHWIYVEELQCHLRVVTLSDGKTVHNAFPDRKFAERISGNAGGSR